MLETVSVFDAMELDNTQVRVASRRALALAHTRVESHLGRFLRAAQTEEEFFERLALVAEDFDGYVVTASREVGHDKPEHIAAALKDHYRLAAQPAEFVKTPEEEEKEAEEEEEHKVTRLTKKDRKALKRLAKSDRTWSITAVHDKQSVFPETGYGVTDNSPAGMQVDPQTMQQAQQQRVPSGYGVTDNSSAGMLIDPQTMQQAQQQRQQATQQVQDDRDQYLNQQNPLMMTPDVRNELSERTKANPQAFSSVEGKQGSPLAVRQSGPYQHQPYPNDKYPEPDPLDQEWDIDRPAFFDQSGQIATDPLRDQQGYIGPGVKSPYKDISRDEGYEQIPYVVNPEDPRTRRDHGNDRGLEIAPNLPSVSPPRGAPIRQGSNEHEQVTCPECGGDGKQAGVNTCGKCKGAGRVPNFGDSMVDAVGADIKTTKTAIAIDDMPMMQQQQQNAQPQPGQAPQQPSMPPSGTPEYDQWIQQQRAGMQHLVTVPQGAQISYDNNRQMPPNWKGPSSGDPNYLQNRQSAENHNNTDLGGPEPKMDKAKWTPSNPGEPKVEDGLWPNKRKDVTEPIKATNDSPLTEIGEKSTETKDLPANSGDAGFNTGGEDSGPHTDTFENDGQTDPVTREALANTTHANPLSELLLAEFPPDTVIQAAFLEEALT